MEMAAELVKKPVVNLEVQINLHAGSATHWSWKASEAKLEVLVKVYERIDSGELVKTQIVKIMFQQICKEPLIKK